MQRARKPAEPAAVAEAPPSTLRQRLVCVRLCDGEELVLGFRGGAASDEEYASMCDAAGSGTQTALLSSELGRDGVQLEHFSGRGAGKSYASVAQFVAEERKHGDAGQCSANVAGKPLGVPLHADATLQKGDVVTTSKGFVVFVGDEGPAHDEQSFVPLDRARGISMDVRKALGRLASR